jgi:hypothetical protein
MPTLEAIKIVRYGGKDQQPGDVFEASEKDAKTLKLIKKAKDASGPVKSAADLPSEVMQRSSRREPVTEDEPEVVEKVVEAVKEDEAPKPQTYLHRAMVADKTPGRRGRPPKSRS